MSAPEISQRINARLHELYQRHLVIDDDSMASYYDSARGYYAPNQAGDERTLFAVAVATVDGEVYCAGEGEVSFPLQSLAKVVTYGIALENHGREHVLRRVGVEPSGEAFNSIIFDERHNRPYNPMVNAGALVIGELVPGANATEKFDHTLRKLRAYAGNPSLEVDIETFEAEMHRADHNRATAYLMRSQGMIVGDVEATLALYLRQCSVRVNCRDLAMMAATLANGGINPLTGDCALPRARVRDVVSVMYTCGMYDFAGEWAYEVGVPAKSGVSGGILCVIPGKMGIGVFSPGLDPYGNSVRGVRVCQEISDRLGLHVFATEDEDVMLGAPAATGGR